MAALRGYEVLVARDAAAARALSPAHPPSLVLAQLRLPDESGIAVARACAARWPHAPRLLLCAYRDLPEVVAAQGHEVLSRVLSIDGTAAQLQRAVEQALTPREEVSTSQGRGLDWQAAAELLRWTAVRLTQVRGVVIRPLPRDVRTLQLEFVLLASRRNDALRADVLRRWLWPLKPRDAKPAARDRGNAVLRQLGDLSLSSEVYAKEVPGERLHLYLALLPWRSEPRLTVALGICAHEHRPGLRELLAAAHDRAVAEVAEFSLPSAPSAQEAQAEVRALPDYDWIATADYVGPDRRRAPTGFLNRYLFTGRRKRVPARIQQVTGSFTDRFHGRVWRLFAAFVLLASMDTALSLLLVRNGTVREANPLLRPLVLHHPWLFGVVKSVASLLAFLVVARFQLFRLGMRMLLAAVALYALLDLYWAGLLLFDRLHG